MPAGVLAGVSTVKLGTRPITVENMLPDITCICVESGVRGIFKKSNEVPFLEDTELAKYDPDLMHLSLLEAKFL